MKIFILAFLLSMPIFGLPHETYFSFAEMEYDTECNCLEVTLTLSAHDLESYADEPKSRSGQIGPKRHKSEHEVELENGKQTKSKKETKPKLCNKKSATLLP